MTRSIEAIRDVAFDCVNGEANAMPWDTRDVRTLLAEIDRLNALINSPQTDEFLTAIRLEAAHQQERWSTEHDAGKSDADWFWLLGYLAGKAMRPGSLEKKLHHVITTAAACLNWHAHLTGERTGMRPGIEPPAGEAVT